MRRGGIGVLVRNHNSEVVGGFYGSEVNDNAEYLKAQTVYEGIRLAVENRWEDVVIESDTTSVINHIRGIDKSCRIGHHQKWSSVG